MAIINRASGADIIDTIEEEDRAEIDSQSAANLAPNLVTETIKSISPSKKIFILTNENQGYSKGDFISVLIGNQLVFRALVAKTTTDKLSGIKILKIYNMTLWNTLKSSKEVLVLKGDDSYYNIKDKAVAKTDKKKKSNDKIESEEDLFNSTAINPGDDDQSIEDVSKRLIKPDNLLGLKYSLIQGIDNSSSSVRYPHIAADWGYQIADNIWAEGGVGTNTIRDFPNVTGDGGLDTRLMSFSLRLKYTINAPFYSYIMPYAGYQIVTASSPGAGVADSTSTATTAAVLQKELDLVDGLKKSGPIFGVTILRRIVPGWFARVDLGSDLISGGISLEF